MSQSEREELPENSDNDFSTTSTTREDREATQTDNRSNNESNNNAWPPISEIISLLSGSRSHDNSTESNNGENIDEELSCPICQEIMKDVFVTNCGHSFCYECITIHIEHRQDCPLCRSNVTRAELFPNYQLNKLAENRLKQIQERTKQREKNPVERLILETKGDHLSIAKSLAKSLSHKELTTIFLAALKERKKSEVDESNIKKELLHCFLTTLKKRNKKAVDDLLHQNTDLAFDLKAVHDQEYEQQLESPSASLGQIQQRKRKYAEIEHDDYRDFEVKEEEIEDEESLALLSSSSNDEQQTVNNLPESPYPARMEARFDDLKGIYLSKLANVTHMDKRKKLLHEFSSTIYQLTRYDGYQVLDSLNYTDNRHVSSIVSSMEFDRDQAYFAVAGVTKEIKIFDYGMMGVVGMLHCPLRIMHCVHKVSCLSWSPYIKSQIASSDYEGIIDIWDVSTGQKTTRFQEHGKRAWSVDISQRNPNLLASASDDATVKVWSLASSHSIHTLKIGGNVCCAKFNPENSNYLAIGSADHNVSCYDLRFPDIPVKVYHGHKKAVSYVKWLNKNEIISASTDNTLKLWEPSSSECVRTFSGHANEKNFVGLSINNDWISCGSETNTMYTYHKSSSIPVSTYTFPTGDRKRGYDLSGGDEDEAAENPNNPSLFVSSVCWKKGSSELLAANSKGVIKVLQMK